MKTHDPYYEQTRLTGPERDKLLVKLRKQGLSCAAVGRIVGMSANGVWEAELRIAEGRPGRDPRG